MFKFIVLLECLFFGINYSYTQDYSSALIGRWEDDASTNSTSYQFIIKKKHLAFKKVQQSKLLDSFELDRDELYRYQWTNNRIITYAKLPSLDPMRAALKPPKHTFMRVDSISKDLLFISLSDVDVEQHQLDSMLDNNINLNKFIGSRKARYRKLNLNNKQRNALFLGLWKDKISNNNDSTDFQFFVQKGEFGFLKVKNIDSQKPTAIKPTASYNYKWINQHLIYYYKRPSTSLVVEEENPNKYILMRIEKLTKKELIVTLSSRAFNKAGLDYIKAENDFNSYFFDNQKIFKRIKVVEKKS